MKFEEINITKIIPQGQENLKQPKLTTMYI